jgi:hypothetical protein
MDFYGTFLRHVLEALFGIWLHMVEVHVLVILIHA